MTKKIIKIEDQEIINTLETLTVEVSARKELLGFMVQNNMSIAARESFEAYHKEYEEVFKKYDIAKKDFQEQYVDVIPGAKEWSLNFSSGEVTITIADQ